MKKIIFIFYFLICIFNTSAQSRLGSSLTEIKEEFSKYNLKEVICNDGLNAVSFTISELHVVYYFDKYNICVNTLLTTKNIAVAKRITNYYNSHYIIINDNSWKVAENLSLAIINSYYDDKLGYIFVWDFLKNE